MKIFVLSVCLCEEHHILGFCMRHSVHIFMGIIQDIETKDKNKASLIVRNPLKNITFFLLKRSRPVTISCSVSLCSV